MLFAELFEQILEASQEISRAGLKQKHGFPGNFPNMSRQLTGDFLELMRTCTGNILGENMSDYVLGLFGITIGLSWRLIRL